MTQCPHLYQLERAMLNQENRHYKLRFAFTSIQLSSLPNPYSFCQQQQPSTTNSIELQNRALYLKYTEDVLTRKEEELIELEQFLFRHKKLQDQEEVQHKLLDPLALTELAQTLNKQIQLFKETINKLATRTPALAQHADIEQLTHNLAFVQQSCQQHYTQLRESLLQDHHQLITQREQLAHKLSKLHELQSYQHYLNQLQNVLAFKQQQLQQRETLNKVSHQSNAQNHSQGVPQQYRTFQEENSSHSEVSRKRAKIFQPRSGQEQSITDTVHHQSEVIAMPMQCPPSVHKQSSQIMQERSTNQQQHQLINQGTQASLKDPRLLANDRIVREAAYIRFLRLWTKYSSKSEKAPASHKLLMRLYQWRLNTLFDECIQKSAKQLLWPRRLEPICGIVCSDYTHLTLRKQKYLQQFFNYQRRRFQQRKITIILHSIIKNKNRKERTAVWICFRKYIEKTRLNRQCGNSQTEPLRELFVNQMPTLSQNNLTLSRTSKESRLISNSTADDKLKHSFIKSMSNKSSLHSKSKQKETNVDMNKLKEYIKNQEEVQAKLVVQGAKTEASLRIGSVLRRALDHTRSTFLIGLIRQTDQSRLMSLQKAVNSYQFKWELFMAKARLALTSNSNKVAHLEQLVTFISSDK